MNTALSAGFSEIPRPKVSGVRGGFETLNTGGHGWSKREPENDPRCLSPNLMEKWLPHEWVDKLFEGFFRFLDKLLLVYGF